MNKAIKVSLLIGLLCGCAASGTQVREDQLSQFKKGKTTIQQVIDTLGQPNQNVMASDGTRIICYNYIQVTSRPESFIPVVGGFVGGADAKSNATCLQFTDGGMLKSYTSSSTQSGTGTNLESGAAIKRVPNEPKQAK